MTHSHKPTETCLYSFKVYETNNVYHTDYYDKKGAREIWRDLENNNEVFTCLKGNTNDSYLDEVDSKKELYNF